MTHPNIDLLRRYSATLTAARAAEILPFFTDDCVLHIPGRSPHAGDYRGQDAVLAYYTRIFQDTEGKFENLGIDDIRIDDGKIAEIWVRDWDQYAYDELFADVATAT
jgi:ketosteroid isomerase-like protein